MKKPAKRKKAAPKGNPLKSQASFEKFARRMVADFAKQKQLPPPTKAKITERVLEIARQRTRSDRLRQQLTNPFEVRPPPPGVLPKGAKTIAQDESIDEVTSWAGNAALSGIFNEGLAFMGYPYLAELSQRPEYRRMSERLAMEMTRKWVELQSTGDQKKDAVGHEERTRRIELINKELDRLRARDHFREAIEQDGFFGAGHIYLDLGTTDDRAELAMPIGDGSVGNSMSEAKVGRGSLRRLKVVEPMWVYPFQYNSTDPLKSNWYRPELWYVMSKPVHASRLLTIVSREVPDILKPAYQFGGLSLSQMAKPYVDNWLNIRQSVADIVQAFSVFVLKTTMTSQLETGGQELVNRVELFNMLRNNSGIFLVDKEGEDFANVAAPLGTLDLLQAQAQEQMCSVNGIPVVIFLGLSPHGLNASADGEIRAFYDWVGAQQEKIIRRPLTKLINFAQMSLFGDVDPLITFRFVPLWSLDKKGEAEVREINARTLTTLIDGGVIHTEEGREALASDPDSPFASLDVNDVPEDPNAMGGEVDEFGNPIEPQVDEFGNPVEPNQELNGSEELMQ